MNQKQSAKRRRPPSTPDRPSRAVLFARRHRKKLRFIFGTLIIACGLVVSITYFKPRITPDELAYYREKLFTYLPLKISKIEIAGNVLTSRDEILKALQVSIGRSILSFSVSAARHRLDALPFVDHATVERRMPDTLIVKIFERAPIAVWQDRGQFILINRAGERVPDQGLAGKNVLAFRQLPLVVGAGANRSCATLIDTLNTYPSVKKVTLAAIRIGERRWNLKLRDGTTVYLPEAHEAAAIERLAEYQKKYRLLERPVTFIDMRLPDRMVIHLDKSVNSSTTSRTKSPSGSL